MSNVCSDPITSTSFFTGKTVRQVFPALLILLLVGCRTIQPEKEKPSDEIINRSIQSLDSFWIEQLNLDYAADCRIRVKTPSMDENGSCHVVITRDSRLQMTVSSRIAGTILSIYQDHEHIQLLNYHDKTALMLESSDRNRYKVLETMNFDGAEFRAIFWGREISADRTGLLFGYKNERPLQIRKMGKRSEQVVTIKGWLDYKGVSFPRIINFDDDLRNVHLKIVITQFKPGLSYKAKPLVVPDSFTVLQ